jgi:hypothetical protein
MRKRLVCSLLLLFFLGAGVGAAPVSLGRRYTDESSGFSMRIPSKWDQVPTKFQEVLVVGNWNGQAKRGYRQPGGLVLRFLKNRVPDAETPSEALERGIPGYGGMMRDQPDDVWDYVRRIFRGSKPEVATDEPEFKMSSKKLKAHVRVLHQQGGGGDRDAEKMLALVVAAQISTIEESDTDFGVIFMCTLADEKHILRAFLSAIKGFRILDPDEEDEDGDDDGGSSRSGDDGIFVDSTKKPEVWREARK